MRIALVISFRETNWRRPLQEPAVVEVWNDESQELVAILPAAVLEGLVRTHLDMAETQARLQGYLLPRAAPPVVEPPPPPPLPVPMTPAGPRLRGRNGRPLRGLPPPPRA